MSGALYHRGVTGLGQNLGGRLRIDVSDDDARALLKIEACGFVTLNLANRFGALFYTTITAHTGDIKLGFSTTHLTLLMKYCDVFQVEPVVTGNQRGAYWEP